MNRARAVMGASLLAIACGSSPVAAPSAPPTPYPHPDPVLIEYSATPQIINRGQSATLRWRGEGFGVLEIVGVAPVLPLVGSFRVTPSGTTTYTLVTTGLHGGGAVYHLNIEVQGGQ